MSFWRNKRRPIKRPTILAISFACILTGCTQKSAEQKVDFSHNTKSAPSARTRPPATLSEGTQVKTLVLPPLKTTNTPLDLRAQDHWKAQETTLLPNQENTLQERVTKKFEPAQQKTVIYKGATRLQEKYEGRGGTPFSTFDPAYNESKNVLTPTVPHPMYPYRP